ncbi:MAG: DUF3168 domain-containing protein, partial [Endomicrobium sp.]|nr:DUF3168 domain-containing protein [Endomicrobium sp.]
MLLGIKLYNYLLQNSSITGLVSDRIYPLTAPSNTQTPYLTFRIVSGSCQYSLDGNSGQGKTKAQICIFFDDYLQANDIAEVLETEMEKWPSA